MKRKHISKCFIIITVFIILVILGAALEIAIRKSNSEKSSNILYNQLSNNMRENVNNIRKAAVAGSFYPASRQELEIALDSYLGGVAEEKLLKDGNIRAVIVPHAGYVYSGPVAAYSYKQIAVFNPKRIFMLGPSHHVAGTKALLSSADYFETPLGEVRISPLNKILAQGRCFDVNDLAHAREHSLEVQLPFLQVLYNDFEIIPILLNQADSQTIKQISTVIDDNISFDDLLIVSTDLSHYYDYETAEQLDQKMINDIVEINPSACSDDEMCGKQAVQILLELAKNKGWNAQVLDYRNSGDTKGGKDQVVGYAAIVFYDNVDYKPNENSVIEYSEDEKKEMLAYVKEVIRVYYQEEKQLYPLDSKEKYREYRGAFVTLNKSGQLRGCIGNIEPVKTLGESLRDNAISACVNDQRFTPVVVDEIAELEIEISILTPKVKTSSDMIQRGDGVILQQGMDKATYLPQVWEQISSREEFFSSLCLKAGLGSNCYFDSKTEFFKYQAIIFGEKDFNL